jgi:predicted phosphodiesterase
MKIKVVSDLHLEFSDVVINNNEQCDVLILSGDICIAEDLHMHPHIGLEDHLIDSQVPLGSRQIGAIRYRKFFKRVSEAFPAVIYIMGNHEFYHGKWVKSIGYLREEFKQYPNIHFLEQDNIVIKDITFIGGTLWTDMNRVDPITLHSVRDMMNDFSVIRNDDLGYTPLRPAHTVSRHRRMVEYIKTIVAGKHDEKFVVVGHHAPTRLSIHEHYRDQYLMNGAYASDLSEFILDHPQIKLWTHGHTHHVFDYLIGTTRVICNPRGYEGSEPDSGWNKEMFIDL